MGGVAYPVLAPFTGSAALALAGGTQDDGRLTAFALVSNRRTARSGSTPG